MPPDFRSHLMIRTKRLFLFACILLPPIAHAEPAPPLLEIFLDEPEIQTNLMIWDFGDREEFASNSNYFLRSRQEFGRYVRTPTHLAERVDRLARSLGTGYQLPTERHSVWPNWHVIIKGEEIYPPDPRFDGAFKLLHEEMKARGWHRKEVTTATLTWRPFQLLVSHLRYPDKKSELLRPHITREAFFPFDSCRNSAAGHLVCRVTDGFILLSNPPKKIDLR